MIYCGPCSSSYFGKIRVPIPTPVPVPVPAPDLFNTGPNPVPEPDPDPVPGCNTVSVPPRQKVAVPAVPVHLTRIAYASQVSFPVLGTVGLLFQISFFK
jgi:hypothetical protein